MNHLLKYWMCSLAALLAACASPPPETVEKAKPIGLLRAAPDAPPAQVPAYRLGVGDEVEVRFAGRAELSQSVRVGPDGRIALQHLPPLQAGGLSADEVEAAISAAIDNELRKGGQAALDSARYILSSGDDIEVRFANHPALSQLARVLPDGRISLPLIKGVAVAGKSPEELEAELIRAYGSFLKQPDLVVVVRTFNAAQARVRVGKAVLPAGLAESRPAVVLKSFSQPQVFVAGEVARPGVLAYRSRLSLLQAIVEAGGSKPTGELRSVLVLRKSDADGALMIRRNLLADLSGNETRDIELSPSDIVIVPKTAVASFAEAVDQYVYQVLAPLKNSSLGFIYNIRSQTVVTQ